MHYFTCNVANSEQSSSCEKEELIMNKEQKHQVETLFIQGIGVSHIARQLNLPLSTVASHIRRHPNPLGYSFCKQCGKIINPKPGHRKRLFCCDKCRYSWWNNHREEAMRNPVTVTCHLCGKEFLAHESDHRKYCCRSCYHLARRSGETGSESN